MNEREGLVARIRQVRRMAAARDRASAEPTPSQSERLDALEARVAHLERLLEGLQDSVHREAERQRHLIAELQARVAPSAMSAALAKEARDRGL
jgi:uncharacterized coiled-coil protein SlyX